MHILWIIYTNLCQRQLHISQQKINTYLYPLLFSTEDVDMLRGQGYSKGELQAFLDIIEEVKSSSPNKWEEMTQCQVQNYPGQTIIQGKFATLYNNKKPTGDPHYPYNVHRAKQIFMLIKEKTGICEGDVGLGADFLAPP